MTQTIKLDIVGHEDRRIMTAILAANGYKTWEEEDKSSMLRIKRYVCFQIPQ